MQAAYLGVLFIPLFPHTPYPTNQQDLLGLLQDKSHMWPLLISFPAITLIQVTTISCLNWYNHPLVLCFHSSPYSPLLPDSQRDLRKYTSILFLSCLNPEMAPSPTRIDTDPLAHRLLPAPTSPSPTFSFVYFSGFLLPVVCAPLANSCLRLSYLLFPLPRMFFLRLFVFIVVEAVSNCWDSSSEMKELLPSCWKCCGQAALGRRCPAGITAAKRAASPKVVFPYWSSPHLTTDYPRGRNASPPCPNLGQI